MKLTQAEFREFTKRLGALQEAEEKGDQSRALSHFKKFRARLIAKGIDPVSLDALAVLFSAKVTRHETARGSVWEIGQ